jgi:hypothetical protein
MLLLTAAGFLLAGWQLASRALDDDDAGALEIACGAATIAFGLWLAIDWLFALTHVLTRNALIARTVILWVAVVVLWIWRRPVLRRVAIPRTALYALALPLALWTIFIGWRGAIIPPVSHDALAYHLPKAVLYARAHGYVDASRISDAFHDMPVNYEILLTYVMLLQRGDQLTEWMSTIDYLVFVLASGALAWRWWRSSVTTTAAMLFVAGAPILLLQSGADKNDLLVGAFMVLSLVWAGRFWSTGRFSTLLLLGTSLLIAIGTKPQAALLAIALAPFVVLRARHLRARQFFPAIAFAIAGVLLLGGATYLDDYVSPPTEGAFRPVVQQSESVVHYGDWANLWQGPYVLAAAPFSPSAFWLWVPWESRPWFWKRYEIFFSHLGVPFALCFAGAPFALLAWREPQRRSERLAIAAAALATFIGILPVVFHPHGMYTIGLPRYAMFFAPAVIAWTTGALMLWLSRASRRNFAQVLVVAGALLFIFNAYDVAENDAFAPLSYVLYARRNPGVRHVPFDANRATSVVDRVAGPNDVIALDVAWGSWIHPAFGAGLSRPIYFIPPGEGAPRIPERADWVVVERAFQTTWGNPQMKTLASAREMFGTRKPGKDETRVTDALKRDPRFALVYEDRKRNQAVFQRIRR